MPPTLFNHYPNPLVDSLPLFLGQRPYLLLQLGPLPLCHPLYRLFKYKLLLQLSTIRQTIKNSTQQSNEQSNPSNQQPSTLKQSIDLTVKESKRQKIK